MLIPHWHAEVRGFAGFSHVGGAVMQVSVGALKGHHTACHALDSSTGLPGKQLVSVHE